MRDYSLREGRPGLVPVLPSVVVADSHASSRGAYLEYCGRGGHWLSTRLKDQRPRFVVLHRPASMSGVAQGDIEAGWDVLPLGIKQTGRQRQPGALLDRKNAEHP